MTPQEIILLRVARLCRVSWYTLPHPTHKCLRFYVPNMGIMCHVINDSSPWFHVQRSQRKNFGQFSAATKMANRSKASEQLSEFSRAKRVRSFPVLISLCASPCVVIANVSSLSNSLTYRAYLVKCGYVSMLQFSNHLLVEIRSNLTIPRIFL